MKDTQFSGSVLCSSPSRSALVSFNRDDTALVLGPINKFDKYIIDSYGLPNEFRTNCVWQVYVYDEEHGVAAAP